MYRIKKQHLWNVTKYLQFKTLSSYVENYWNGFTMDPTKSKKNNYFTSQVWQHCVKV